MGPALGVNDAMRTIGIAFTKAGSIASLACVVHCALTPIVVLAIPFISIHSWFGADLFLDALLAQTTEWVFLIMMIGLTGLSLILTYPLHRDVRPMYLAAFGIGLLILTHFLTDRLVVNEFFLELPALGFIAWAALWNRRICHCHGCRS